MSQSLHGKVALVTGNSTGLGKAIGRCLGEAGAKVPVNFANNETRANLALQEYKDAGIATSLEIEAQLGPVDIIVANATCEQPLKPIEEYDWEFYQRMIDFFIKSPYLLTRRALANMKDKRWGRIINITSEVYQRSVSPFSAYVAAKGGQVGWSRSMSQELAPHGITVNMVAPGWIPVERHESDPQEMKDEYLEMIPMGRWGTPEDIGQTVKFLASDEASFITGQTTCVNGGMSPW